MEKELLKCRKIEKAFGDNAVLKGIDLSLSSGEVIALIGGNGAGKSTLMKIFMGIYRADAGEITISGKKLQQINPSLALSNGIYLVPQEPMLFKNMTVAENVLLGLKGDKTKNSKKLHTLLTDLKWDIDLSRKADTLTIAEQQLVEILKGLIRESQILILDEPTSALTFNDIQSLFELIENLKQKGVGIIYITHRLNEVFEIATDVVIMKDGVVSLRGKVTEFNNEMLINALLSGTKNEQKVSENKEEPKKDFEIVEMLRLENFSGDGFKDVNLSVKSGEILGLAGVVGAGRTELAEAIFGKGNVSEGTAYLQDTDITGKSTKKVINLGLNYVPEDRFKNGIFRESDIGMNMSASTLQAMGRLWVKRKVERNFYDYFKRSFRIKSTAIDQEIGDLSGGNQQKIVISKAIASMPKVLILDEPTRGIDAGARGDVYRIIDELKSQGLAILLISSDMEEIVQLSDRALTMYRGRINAEYEKSEITPENLTSSSFGIVKEGGAE